MSIKVASNRFIFTSIAKSAAFYQQINTNVFDFHKMGARLSSHAENLQAFRQTEKLKTVAEVLSNLPLQEYKLKGQYYLAWCGYRNGQDTRRDFELVVEKSGAFRDKSLISLAGLEIARKDYAIAMKHYEEAIKWAKSPATLITAIRSIAIYKSDCGNHKEALSDLEGLYPLVHYAEPKAQYDYLNSYAVELGEAGRIEEAQNVCRITLASPFINAYPEWRETGQDLALRGYKSRSSVRVTQKIPGNLFYLPEREPSDTPSTPIQRGRARLFSLEKWKEEKMVKEPNGEDENVDAMDFNELIVKLLQLTAYEGVNEKKVRKIVKLAIEVMKEKD
jgi:tetratricopeptide (TPR) repeat protein